MGGGTPVVAVETRGNYGSTGGVQSVTKNRVKKQKKIGQTQQRKEEEKKEGRRVGSTGLQLGGPHKRKKNKSEVPGKAKKDRPENNERGKTKTGTPTTGGMEGGKIGFGEEKKTDLIGKEKWLFEKIGDKRGSRGKKKRLRVICFQQKIEKGKAGCEILRRQWTDQP